jgi:anaerobic sulfite reductase subunit B
VTAGTDVRGLDRDHGSDTAVPRPHSIVGARGETPDTMTFELESVDGQPTPFAPGQFAMLSVFGVGESAISISGDPAHPERVTQTVRAVGTVTHRLHRMGVGDVVGVRGPYGRGWPLDAATGTDLLIVAGGLGLAPVRPAILAALTRRERHERVAIVIGARSPSDLLYRDELLGWAARDDVQVAVTVDTADPGWRGPVGVVTRLLPTIDLDPHRATALVCGPEVMMRHTVRELVDRGMAQDRIHVSLERNMRCGVGTCGHCQLGPLFICRDGPVLSAERAGPLMEVRER